MSDYQARYGVKEDEKIVEFHKSRRMFAIYKSKLHIAPPNVSCSHAVWFEKMGWMTYDDDKLMAITTRGFVDKEGDVRFYAGYDFHSDDNSEKEFLRFLPELAKKLKLQDTAVVYSGLIKPKEHIQPWPGKKRLGAIGELIG